MSVLVPILAFIVAVAILITVHEFGHFIVARLLGVKVTRFSVGFGRPILRWQRGEGTEYAIGWLPLGGYVTPLDERVGEVAEADLPRAINRQPIWKRAAILTAGPAFNLLFAVFAYWAVFMAGIPGIKPVLGPVAAHSPAAQAGVAAHDTILAVNGKRTPTWQTARLAILDGVALGRPLVLEVATPAGVTRTRTLHYNDAKALAKPEALFSGLGLEPWLPPVAPVLGRIEPDGAAARAGLATGDRIAAVDGKSVTSWKELVKAVQAAPNRRLLFEVRRDGRHIEVPVVVGTREEDGKRVGYLGVAVRIPKDYAKGLRAEYRLGPLAALGAGAVRTGEMTAMTAAILYRMVTGSASLSNLSGPIGIAQYAGASAEAGIISFLLFLALISISLGILNLLPIPILDGGQLMFLGIECVRRRPLSEHAEALGQRLGLSLIAILLGFTVFNDLSRIIHS